ncbi:hypothetical protein GS438_13680 [Rhodococcus hoagii]|nr:hypothetical protein [Prescottella equi]
MVIEIVSPTDGVELLTVRLNALLPSDQFTDAAAAPADPTPTVAANPAAIAKTLTPPTIRRNPLPTMHFPLDDDDRSSAQRIRFRPGTLRR